MIDRPESASTVLIRTARIDESSAIASLLREAFIAYEPLYTPAAFAVTTPTSVRIRERWSEGPVWVAVQEENLVGTVAAVPKEAGLYIRSMAVLPVARGQGIAMQLLNEIESFAVATQHARLFLRTTPFLTSAIRLYERFGFERKDEGLHDLFETPLFTMVKQLEHAERESKKR